MPSIHHLFCVALLPAGGFTVISMALACFLIGGIPFGFVVGKLKGIDIRNEGSGNIGATNVLRVMGRGWGYSVFALDFLKALLPVLALRYLLYRNWIHAAPLSNESLLILCGVLVVLGHNYCPYLGFKGGKGMTSSAGFLMALMPWVFLSCFLTWLLFFYATRYVSVASMMASLSVPIATWFFYRGKPEYLGLGVILFALGIWRHRSNIVRLAQGTEHRFGDKKA